MNIMDNASRSPGQFVSIGSAALHMQMEELFGLPEITHACDDELFGPYEVEGERRFWRYSATNDAWTVLTCPKQPCSLLVPVDGDSYGELLEALDALRGCPPVRFPTDMNERTASEPFAFGGWRFFWVFYPDLARWELAPAGRA